MVFNSFNFIVLFPFLFLLYYLIPARLHKCRNIFLLIVSYSLYIKWKPAFGMVLLVVSLITYWGGVIIDKLYLEDESRSDFIKRRKQLMWVFILLAIFPLMLFKYYNFLNESLATCFASIGIDSSLPGLNWAVPVGISFFTFQSVGYMLDVYHRRIRAEKDVLCYLLFVSFFPSILSGPINKASLLIPQIKGLRQYFDYDKAVAGLKLILWGMFMKVVVADRVALYVDTILSNYMNYTGITCFVASVMYSIQIYADFAGYSLMAIGVGKTLGFELTENFRHPYFAYCITDFWHRWHISLSTWLKDYIYIPLGGSRCSKLRNYRNIFVTFLISGTWHGANWTFIIWGCMHGLLQIIEKAMGIQKRSTNGNRFALCCRILVTFVLVNFAWIIFRMPTLNDATRIIGRMFDLSLPIEVFMPHKDTMLLMCFGIFVLFIKDFYEERNAQLFLLDNKYYTVRWASYIILTVSILLTGVLGAGQFIYANF